MHNYSHLSLCMVGLERHDADTSKPQSWPAHGRCITQRLALILLLLGFSYLSCPPVSAQNQDVHKVLVLGVRTDAPPFSSCSIGQSGQLENCHGYSVALCQRIAARAIKEGLYCSSTFKQVSVSDRFKLLQDGEIDLLCGASTVTLERMRIMDFSLFTFLSGASIMYPEPVTQQDNRKKNVFKVGVLKDTTTKDKVQKILQRFKERQNDFEQQSLSNPEVMELDSHSQGLDELLDGTLNAYIADREILLALQHKAKVEKNFELVVSQDYFSVEPYAIGIRLGNPDLRYITNSVLSELFDWNHPVGDGVNIFDVLKQNFPGKRFSKSLENMFRIQRLNAGNRLTEPINKVKCTDHTSE